MYYLAAFWVNYLLFTIKGLMILIVAVVVLYYFKPKNWKTWLAICVINLIVFFFGFLPTGLPFEVNGVIGFLFCGLVLWIFGGDSEATKVGKIVSALAFFTLTGLFIIDRYNKKHFPQNNFPDIPIEIIQEYTR